ncbi:beta-propeller fold lactonase family protein [Duganella sp. FT80W]|uniref:Beta-propeller fold lactonase family protein n=1 Tax=Duganella guangzhouensis TaxID=2666084 RepID=A0A6I2L6X3_9BURK|nr:lactonase family protein [Duganella guangzhouensis]MRW93941.1 beta-propeller fold lactonase family protein [Duganella guangzhouensis]
MKHILAAALMTLTAGLAHADWVYVGTQGNQLRALHFDPASGKLSDAGAAAEGLRPTWTTAHPQLPVLYTTDDQQGKEGAAVAFAINRATGALSKLNSTPSGGGGATYLWLDAPSNTLLVSNYGGGSASSIVVNADGSLGGVVSTIKATGSGPHKRQTSPHAHAVAVDPSGRYALVPDLGVDRVFVYPLERATHTLSADDAGRSWVAPAGTGPRHLVISADGRYVYVVSELTAEVITLRWDAQAGRLTHVRSQPISSEGFSGTRSAAEITRSPDGRFLYIEDRGEGTLVVYRIDATTGELGFVQRLASGGDNPWGMEVHSSGRWLLVTHQRSGSVNVFRIDAATGQLSATSESVAVAAPVNLTFVSEGR